MGQQVSIIELKEQIEAAKRSLAEMSPVDIAADPLFQPAAMPTANSAGLAGGHEDDAPDAFNQNLLANDDMASCMIWRLQIWRPVKWRPVKTFNFSTVPNGRSAICPIIAYEHGKC